MKTIIFLGLIFSYLTTRELKAAPIEVRIAAMEALAETEANPSDRYSEQYKASLFYGLGETQASLKKCGYAMSWMERYFDPKDKVAAAEQATKLVELKPWIILGPRRSDHLLAVHSAVPQIPKVSTYANAEAVFEAKGSLFSMGAPNKILAKAASDEIKRRRGGKRFGVVTDLSCKACNDFAGFIEKELGPGFKKEFHLSAVGENPDVGPVLEAVGKQKIDFLVVPNFAALSAMIIQAVYKKDPSILFVGADGWGDGKVGYFNTFGFKNDTKAFCVRQDRPYPEMVKKFGILSLARNWTGEDFFPPSSSFYNVHFIRGLSKLLCEKRPKNQIEFKGIFERESKRYFSSIIDVGVYELKDGILAYRPKKEGEDR